MAIFDVHSFLGGSYIPGISHNGASVNGIIQARQIESTLLLSAHARHIDPVSGNRILKATVEQNPNLYGCLVTHTNRIEASISVMRELMTNRKFLAMAIVGTHENEPVQHIVADDIINAYRRYGKPLFLFAHNAAMVTTVLEIAKTFNMLKIVMVGMGGHDWRNAIAAAHETTNIYLDTSGVLDQAKLPAAIEAIGAHRILFGSGSPHVDPVAALGLIDECGLAPETRRRILHDNAIKVFGLDQAV